MVKFFSMVAPEAEWVEEFQDITDEDVEATFSRQHDFWNKLEDEWKEMAERNKETGEHPWLDDFEEVCKVENVLKGSLDSIPSPSPSAKIQIMGGKFA